MTDKNDGETTGPDRIWVAVDGDSPPYFYRRKRIASQDIEYIRADLYTQSQRELAEAKSGRAVFAFDIARLDKELAEVKRERDDYRSICDHLALNPPGVVDPCVSIRQERDRYREAILKADRYLSLGSATGAWNVLQQALNPHTPKPDDAVTREGG